MYATDVSTLSSAKIAISPSAPVTLHLQTQTISTSNSGDHGKLTQGNPISTVIDNSFTDLHLIHREGTSWGDVMETETMNRTFTQQDDKSVPTDSIIHRPANEPVPIGATSQQPVSVPTYAQKVNFVPIQVSHKPATKPAAAKPLGSKPVPAVFNEMMKTANSASVDEEGYRTVFGKKKRRPVIPCEESQRKDMLSFINTVAREKKNHIANLDKFCHMELHDKTFVMFYINAGKLVAFFSISENEKAGMAVLNNLADALMILKYELNDLGMILRFYSNGGEHLSTPFEDFQANFTKHAPKEGVACYEVGISHDFHTTVNQLLKGTKYTNELGFLFATGQLPDNKQDRKFHQCWTADADKPIVEGLYRSDASYHFKLGQWISDELPYAAGSFVDIGHSSQQSCTAWIWPIKWDDEVEEILRKTYDVIATMIDYDELDICNMCFQFFFNQAYHNDNSLSIHDIRTKCFNPAGVASATTHLISVRFHNDVDMQIAMLKAANNELLQYVMSSNAHTTVFRKSIWYLSAFERAQVLRQIEEKKTKKVNPTQADKPEAQADKPKAQADKPKAAGEEPEAAGGEPEAAGGESIKNRRVKKNSVSIN